MSKSDGRSCRWPQRLYAPDGLLVSPSVPIVRGREALRAYYSNRFASGARAMPLKSWKCMSRAPVVMGLSSSRSQSPPQVAGRMKCVAASLLFINAIRMDGTCTSLNRVSRSRQPNNLRGSKRQGGRLTYLPRTFRPAFRALIFDVPIKNPSPLQATLFELGHTPIDVWTQKMDIDGDGERREFGLRGQRRGTESIVAEMVERREGMEHPPVLKRTKRNGTCSSKRDSALRGDPPESPALLKHSDYDKEGIAHFVRRLHERGVKMTSAGRLQVPHRLRKHFDKVVHCGGRFEALSSPEQHFKLTLRTVQNVYAHAGRAATKHEFRG